jgi:hypothetical protein
MPPGIVAFFEKIYDREAILIVFSESGENILHRCFNSVSYVRTVLQPDIDDVFGRFLYSNNRNRVR